MSPQAKATKAQINKWDYANQKAYTAKETINKTSKRQPIHNGRRYGFCL